MMSGSALGMIPWLGPALAVGVAVVVREHAVVRQMSDCLTCGVDRDDIKEIGVIGHIH